ncbi:family 20 glycosylhydrolase [Shewanella sp. GXUN23E]|uniref:family 20 glycosylhydrolase n=1 Tax=Shewanella sp. GXUN23E TaxID=3422498 RepID=UPI003D7DEEAE
MTRNRLAAAVLLLGITACSESMPVGNAVESRQTTMTQTQLAELGQQLQVQYELLTNVPGEHCPKSKDRCFRAAIHFTTNKDMPQTDWAIYFSQMRPVLSVDSALFTIEHVKGDLYRILPLAAFRGFKANETVSLPFVGELWQLGESDVMPNYYLTSGTLTPEVIVSTQTMIDKATGMEIRPHLVPFSRAEQYLRRESDNLKWVKAADLYKANSATSLRPELVDSGIIPAPSHLHIDDTQPDVSLKAGIRLLWDDVPYGDVNAGIQAGLERLAFLGVRQSSKGVVLRLSLNDSLPVEGYRLTVSQDVILLTASDVAGLNHGLVSLAALLVPDELTLAAVEVEDAPRYGYRGLHIDVARNFHDKVQLFKIIDQMHAYKLNKLHLHMGDDEGWRLEINGLPELTEIGSKRCHDLSETRCLLPQLGSGPHSDTDVNGYYSRQDYIDILKYAGARHIQVIPSMDMPGHSRAAVKAMEARYRKKMVPGDDVAARQYLLTDFEDQTRYSSIQYYDDNTLNVCIESTFTFIDKVIEEIAGMHQAAGMPLSLYHIGADETAGAWVQSPACEAFIEDNPHGVTEMSQLGPYFIERISGMLAAKGIDVAGWSDGMGHTRVEHMPADAQTHLWDTLASGGHINAHKQVNYGWRAIVSSPDVLYFDFPYEATPKEHGYYWAQRRNNSKQVFSFMPDNLPANAEQWTDLENQPYEADDRVKRDEQGKLISAPIEVGKGVEGIQGQLWSETVRSDQLVDYMLFPRVLMLAERAWHKAEWEVPYNHQGAVYHANSGYFTPAMRAKQAADWERVANILGQKELAKLDRAGVEYRLPVPGAIVRDGKLYANVIFPGLAMEYRTADGEWLPYVEGVNVTLPVEIRSIAPDGQRRSRTQAVDQP